jgi:hypothetical protein
MSTYLEQHHPRVRQFRRPRRAKPSGLIVVHTAESVMDVVGPDTGAENVAAFIAGRSDYGSYHTLVDSDSRVRLVPFDAEAYGDGTGSNPFAIHISFALAAADWPRLTPEKRALFIRRGAQAAAEAARWVSDVHGIDIPAQRVTLAQSNRRVPGFISHGERDPGRRTDPGAAFPWSLFLAEYAARIDPARPVKPTRQKLTAAIRQARADGWEGIANRLAKVRASLTAKGRSER